MTDATQQAPAPTEAAPVPRRSRLWLALIAAAFLAVRVPVMYRQPGGQDEGDYSVPGWTVLREGIPRIPFIPSRNPEAAYYKADVALFALPPAGFYWQSAFYAAFGPSYGTARLAAGTAGLIAVALVYWLARQFYGEERPALLAASLFSLSRVFYFPCLSARPDMLCGTIGIAAIACGWHWYRSGKPGWAAAAGGLTGLGLLTHPFALVYAIQLGVWVLAGGRGGLVRRLRDVALFGACSLAAFSCWLPLILAYPEVFRAQFFNNVLDRAGPGLLERLVLIWAPLRYHAGLLLEHAGVVQLALMALGLLAATAYDLRPATRNGRSGPVAPIVLAWSGAYLLIACQGIHPIKTYWVYPSAFLFICVGRAASLVLERVSRLFSRPAPALWAVSLLFVAAFLPGAGLRAWAAYVRHWSDPAYNSPRFAEQVLRDIPREARLVVDPAHVFEAYLAGRPTVLAATEDFYFNATTVPCDFLIASRFALARDIPRTLDVRLVRTHGDSADPFACFVRIYEAAQTEDSSSEKKKKPP